MRTDVVRIVRAALLLPLLVVLAALRAAAADTYSVSGVQILKNGSPGVWGGVNAFHAFGGSSSAMADWNIDVVREVIPNVSETPIGRPGVDDWTVQASDGSYLHPLQKVVDDNRAHGKITILCPFKWSPQYDQMAGKSPRQMPYYAALKDRMRLIARQFANQSDVWLEVWNEPYDNDNDPNWLSDMRDMVDNIRAGGNRNIVLVPGCKWGSSESVILSQGASLLSGRSNIVFDLHAYYDWTSNDQHWIEGRIQSVRDRNFALVFAEVGPAFDGAAMDTRRFLNAALAKRVTTLAWDWNTNAQSNPNALLTESGGHNDTAYNFRWGSTFRSFLRAFKAGASLVEGVYTLSPGCAPGAFLEVAGAATWNGANVQIWSGAGYAPHAWRLDLLSDNSYRLTPTSTPGRVLDVAAGGSASGTNVQIWDDFGAPAQKWAVSHQGGASYRLSPRHAPGTSLDVSGAGSAPGTNVQIWQENGTAAQRWYLMPQ